MVLGAGSKLLGVQGRRFGDVRKDIMHAAYRSVWRVGGRFLHTVELGCFRR